jgi:hypothetical protein
VRKALLVVCLIVFVVLLSSSIVLAADVVVEARTPEGVGPNSHFMVPISVCNNQSLCAFQFPVTFYHNTNNDVRCDSIQWTSAFLETGPTMLAGQNGDITYLHNNSETMAVLPWAVWFNGIGMPAGKREICKLYFTTGAKFDKNVGFHLDITSNLDPPGPPVASSKEGKDIPVVFKVNAGDNPGDVGGSALPKEFNVGQNYPNPFNPSTTIEIALPNDGEVSVTAYNVLGQKVRTLVNGNLRAGIVRVQWDGTADNGEKVASGVYFLRVSAPGNMVTIKTLLAK